jgi:hypothetical protein
MMGRFFRSLYVGKITEYLFAFAAMMDGDCKKGRISFRRIRQEGEEIT